MKMLTLLAAVFSLVSLSSVSARMPVRLAVLVSGSDFFYTPGVRLLPDQCHTWTATWDGYLEDGVSLPSLGSYVATGGLFHGLGPLTIVVPESDLLLALRIADTSGIPEVPEILTTWGRIKLTY